ncbi:aminotransferase class V-fold PLP-dependent enzyme [Actinokineospora spheciospongiae]|uniref:aminotransferase class V-fold PLP-dependent enzyme n=1 Tax=Actinokineospora spheciospongiae TaxID=909613 RepID=UPI000D712414|nr:aminotransferase class V-fold PLP-dependent enzyme [Actinokineospora spheciospongiae]PWW52648.1 selenocysteine lyase/cysteine desulfurase [Actinokineospora spheciospongiae]
MESYLDYAGLGRLREPARVAMAAALNDVFPFGSAEIGRVFPARRRARALAAGLLDCREDEIAFVPNTSTGLQLVADGIDWRPGDEVVVFEGDFPANVHPWRRLDGVRLRWVPLRGNGYRLDDVAAALGPRTRLVAVSHVHFATGFRVDLDAVVALAHAAGALVCVDAVQSLGVVPLSLRATPVDFLAAGAHKWLCGPTGTGIFFCRGERLDELRLPCGWVGYEGANDLFDGPGLLRYDLRPRPSAARVEGGMYDVLAMVGLAETLAELAGIGLGAVAARVRGLTARLRAGLLEAGCELATPGEPSADEWSGIVAFRHPARTGGDLVAALLADGHHVSHPDGWVRAAPHHWTGDAEIGRFLTAVTRRVS